MSSVQNARIRKTKEFFHKREDFFDQLKDDIRSLIKKAEREGYVPSVRLNGTSDLPWEKIKVNGETIFESFPDLQFYDYTKVPNRTSLPDNYHLTFSLSEDNDKEAGAEMARGINVAAVFRELPEKFWGYPVFDGDETDLRFLDPKGHIIGLKAKGTAKHDTSGFVR